MIARMVVSLLALSVLSETGFILGELVEKS